MSAVRIACVATAAVLVYVALPSQALGAKKAKVKVSLEQVSAGEQGTLISGKLESSNAKCTKKRSVTMAYDGGVNAKSSAKGVFHLNAPTPALDDQESAWPFEGGAYPVSIDAKGPCKGGSSKLRVTDSVASGTSNHYSGAATMFSGQFVLNPPCDTDRSWAMFRSTGGQYQQVGDNSAVGSDGSWSYMTQGSPPAGTYDAYLFPELRGDGAEASGDFDLVECGALDTDDVTISR